MKVFFPLLSAFLFVCQYGCTKHEDRWSDKTADTVHDTVSNLASTRILAYQVTNTGEDVIYSSVDDKEKTITVYLPHYYALTYLEPGITLTEGATITPGANDLVPVFGTVPFTYLVTGKNKETATYTMKIVIQQPQFTLTELSTATATTNLSTGVLQIKGNNMLPNYDATKVYLVNNAGNKVYSNFSPTNTGTTQLMTWFWGTDAATNPALAANTDYWVVVESYSLKVKMQYPVRINK